MKEFITKNWKTILVIAIILIVLWYFFLRKKKAATAIASPSGGIREGVSAPPSSPAFNAGLEKNVMNRLLANFDLLQKQFNKAGCIGQYHVLNSQTSITEIKDQNKMTQNPSIKALVDKFANDYTPWITNCSTEAAAGLVTRTNLINAVAFEVDKYNKTF